MTAALIIGAGDATGGAIAKAFAAEGYVACVNRRPRHAETLEKLAQSIRDSGHKAQAFPADARDEDAMIALVENIERDIGPIDVAVFNIGANVRFGITETTAQVYRKVWEIYGPVLKEGLYEDMERRERERQVAIHAARAVVRRMHAGARNRLVRIEEIAIDGVTQKTEVPVSTLIWGTKKFESGFFNLPDSEHISAVMFNAAGTLSKFNRMGIAAGMGDPNVTVVHTGTRFAKDNSAQEERFEQPVTVDYAEDWVDGLTVFHNPKALHPLSFDVLPGAAHVYEENGAHPQCVPAGHLVSTMTEITVRV